MLRLPLSGRDRRRGSIGMPGSEISEGRNVSRHRLDLAALSALPAIWNATEPRRVAEAMVDALVKVLRPDLVHVRLSVTGSEDGIDVTHSDGPADAPIHRVWIDQALAPSGTRARSDTTVHSLPHPLGNGPSG